MENIEREIEDKDFDALQELGCFKNRPFAMPSSYELFGLAGANEEELQQKPYYKTLSFIKEILNIGFCPEDMKKSFVPECSGVLDDGKYYRTLMPEDITSEQAEILFRNLDKIESFYIKARITDVLWESKKLDKKENKKIVEIVKESYNEFVYYVLQHPDKCEKYKTIYLYSSSKTNEITKKHNDFSEKHPTLSFIKNYQIEENYDDVLCTSFIEIGCEALTRRSRIILSLLGGKDEAFKDLIEFFNKPQVFENDEQYNLLLTVGSCLCCLNKKKNSQQLIESALFKYKNEYKRLAVDTNAMRQYSMYEAGIYNIGIKLAEKVGIDNEIEFFRNEKTKALMLIEGSDILPLQMREQPIKDLLDNVNKTKNMSDKQEIAEKYKIKLLENRKVRKITDVPVHVEGKIEFGDFFKVFGKEAEGQGQKFETYLSKFVNLFIDCLFDCYNFVNTEKYNDKEAALYKRTKDVFIDNDGKCDFVANGYKEDKKNEVDKLVLFNMNVLVKMLYGVIEFALREIDKNHKDVNINAHILQMLQKSSFIPNKSVNVFAKGLEHFLHGNIIDAAHILIPNAEECWRNMLRRRKKGTYIFSYNDGTERDSIDGDYFLEECAKRGLLDEKMGFYLKLLLYGGTFKLRSK